MCMSRRKQFLDEGSRPISSVRPLNRRRPDVAAVSELLPHVARLSKATSNQLMPHCRPATLSFTVSPLHQILLSDVQVIDCRAGTSSPCRITLSLAANVIKVAQVLRHRSDRVRSLNLQSRRNATTSPDVEAPIHKSGCLRYRSRSKRFLSTNRKSRTT